MNQEEIRRLDNKINSVLYNANKTHFERGLAVSRHVFSYYSPDDVRHAAGLLETKLRLLNEGNI